MIQIIVGIRYEFQNKSIIIASFVLITQSLLLELFISPVSLTHCIAFFYLNPNIQFNMSPEVDLMVTDSLSIFIFSLFLWTVSCIVVY